MPTGYSFTSFQSLVEWPKSLANLNGPSALATHAFHPKARNIDELIPIWLQHAIPKECLGVGIEFTLKRCFMHNAVFSTLLYSTTIHHHDFLNMNSSPTTVKNSMRFFYCLDCVFCNRWTPFSHARLQSWRSRCKSERCSRHASHISPLCLSANSAALC